MGNIEGTLAEGSFSQKGKKMHFRTYIYTHELTLWQLIITYPDQDPAAHKIAERVAKSFTLAP